MREGWQQTTLGAVTTTAAPSKPTDDVTRYVGLEHIDPGSPRLTRWDSTSSYTSSSTPFRAGDVLFSKLRPYLRKVAVPHFEGRCTTEALVYRPTTERLSREYLGLLLQSREAIAHADRSSAGSRMPRTSTKIMATFPIALPPLDEQRRIVDLIDALDDTIAATERSTQRSAALLDGLRNLTPTGDEVTVGEVVEQIVNGITTSASDQASGTGAQAIIKASAVQAGQFSPHETKWAADEVYDERYYVREGDVLMTRINTPERVGQLARVESTPSRPLIRPDLVWRIDLRPDRILPDYFVHAFSGSSGRRRVSAAASGTSRSMQQISKGRFSRVALVLPSLPQQEAYVARCEAARRVLKEHETASAGLRVCRSNLLTALLSGEHEIPESYDELTKESAA